MRLPKQKLLHKLSVATAEHEHVHGKELRLYFLLGSILLDEYLTMYLAYMIQ